MGDEAQTKPPFAPGSLSVRLYGHGSTAEQTLGTLLEQARAVAAAGFDGITVSEHHGGFAGYLPNPLQLVSWILAECPGVWAAPGPMLLALRPAGLVAEEAAWLATRHPGRIGVGVAAGSLQQDFDIAGVALDDGLAARFDAQLRLVATALRGEATGPLAEDPAVARTRTDPVPVVSAAMSRAAVRRAVGAGVGVMWDSLSSRDRLRQLTDWYLEEGGTGPRIVTRWIWVGAADGARVETEQALYRGYTPADRQAHWAERFDVITGPAEAVAAELVDVAGATSATALNLRLHTAGATPEEIREQIGRLGAEVLPLVRAEWSVGR